MFQPETSRCPNTGGMVFKTPQIVKDTNTLQDQVRDLQSEVVSLRRELSDLRKFVLHLLPQE